jgi:FkbM family methyltransferase
MLDTVPRPVREMLWSIKHQCAVWMDHHGFVQSHQAALQQHLESLAITTVVDVGANDGQYARLMRRLGFRGRIISFEPVLTTFKHLERAAAADPAWTVVPIALGEATGFLDLHLTEDPVLCSALVPSEHMVSLFTSGARVLGQQRAEMRRLDGILPDLMSLGRESLHLKIDTQGFDMEVLRGAEAVLSQVQSLQIELSFGLPLYEGQRTYLQDLAEVQAYGFQLSGLFPVIKTGPGQQIVEADALFCRTS